MYSPSAQHCFLLNYAECQSEAAEDTMIEKNPGMNKAGAK